MAPKEFVIPKFDSEAEEPAWWEKNRAAVEADLRTAKALSLDEVMAQVSRKKHL